MFRARLEGVPIDSRNRNGDDRQRELDLETKRNREATVGYLSKIGKLQTARALDRNRKQIIEDIRDLQ